MKKKWKWWEILLYIVSPILIVIGLIWWVWTVIASKKDKTTTTTTNNTTKTPTPTPPPPSGTTAKQKTQLSHAISDFSRSIDINHLIGKLGI